MSHKADDDRVSHVEDVEKLPSDGASAQNCTSPPSFDPKVAARIRRHIDWRLIPALGAMYGISLMDRKNVSNAAIAGMLKDLNMSKGVSYNLVNMCK